MASTTDAPISPTHCGLVVHVDDDQPSVPPPPSQADGLHGHLRHKKAMFAYLIVMQVLLNYDSGAIPPSLVGHHCEPTTHECGPNHLGDGIAAQFGLNPFTEGLLGSLVYLGLTVACFMAGGVLQTYSPKRVLGIALMFNCASCLLFSASQSLYFFLFSRFTVGLSQAFLVIYPPVWVDEFAPKAHCTTWMSLTQAGVPLGIMLGYAVAGYLVANTPWGWRPAFYAQTIALSLLATVWAFIPSKYIDPNHQHHARIPTGSPVAANGSATFSMADLGHQSGKGLGHFMTLLKQTKRLLFSALWLSTCMALCALYFVVTGIQFWITSYLKAPPISADMNLIITAVAVTSATAPILGVLFGGYMVDRVGGYQERMNRAALGAVIFGALAVACAMASLFVINFWAVIGLVWGLLFFGAGVVPAATGILLACVQRKERPLASAISMLLYNMMGYFAGPLLPGVIAGVAGDLRWSFRVIMLWSLIALFCMILSWRFAERRVRRMAASELSPEVLISEGGQELTLMDNKENGEALGTADGDLGDLTPGYGPKSSTSP